ncbi:MAG: PIN domain-containing protein [Bacteroidota bacterium]|nr:PIN domain-containing protein [Bacteroidota bacterium]
MNKILLDTNIILDIALERREFFEKSKELMLTINKLSIPTYVTATTVTDIYYILKKSKGHQLTISFLKNLFDFIDIAGVNKEVILSALNSELTDFEDAVQAECAGQNDINIIITRNIADFKKSKLEIFTPSEFINQLS